MAKIGKICKEYMIKELSKKIKDSSNIFVTDCTGLNVADLGKLRTNLKPAKGYYVVIKNSLGKLALKEAQRDALSPFIEGSIGLVLGNADPIFASKTLVGFAKESGKLKVKAGLLDGRLIDEAAIKELAILPPREVLLSRMLGGMKAPISGFVNALSGAINKFVYAINAIKDKKEGGAK